MSGRGVFWFKTAFTRISCVIRGILFPFGLALYTAAVSTKKERDIQMTQINQERLVEHFCQLVRIDSESMNEKQIAETLAEQLGELGFTVHKLPVPEHISNGFNVYARLEGK